MPDWTWAVISKVGIIAIGALALLGIISVDIAILLLLAMIAESLLAIEYRQAGRTTRGRLQRWP